MNNRRTILTSLGIGIAGLAAARASEAIFPHLNADSPTATVIKGTPIVLDFADDGVKIPCDKSAFLTLFEGKRFWLTLGAGRAEYAERAQGEAVLYAQAAMKLLLMTLAFTPQRMFLKDGGWKLREQNIGNYVHGDIALPGHPYWPINDAQFMGTEGPTSSFFRGPIGGGGGAGTGPTQGNGPQAPGGSGVGSELNKIDAYTSYIVMKRDADLDYVRSQAQILVR